MPCVSVDANILKVLQEEVHLAVSFVHQIKRFG